MWDIHKHNLAKLLQNATCTTYIIRLGCSAAKFEASEKHRQGAKCSSSMPSLDMLISPRSWARKWTALISYSYIFTNISKQYKINPIIYRCQITLSYSKIIFYNLSDTFIYMLQVFVKCSRIKKSIYIKPWTCAFGKWCVFQSCRLNKENITYYIIIYWTSISPSNWGQISCFTVWNQWCGANRAEVLGGRSELVDDFDAPGTGNSVGKSINSHEATALDILW